LLRADKVSFSYGETRASQLDPRARAVARADVLDDVTAELRRGQILGILGPNGSGKTTLLRLLSGTRTPASGQVLLDGAPLRERSRRAIAQRIAVVPQETHLAFDYTVLELVLMGRHPYLGVFELEGPQDVAIARDALGATGTDALEARQFNTLSGGEKQRVVIAAALAQSAEILLLDEPTSSLDLGYQIEIASLLTRLNRERGVSIAVSTHDLNLAASVCDEIVMIRDGRVIAAGPTADVLTRDNIQAVYDVSADVSRHPSGHLVIVPLARPASHQQTRAAVRSSQGMRP
jgi:iron complex transport system ATP-binding protein